MYIYITIKRNTNSLHKIAKQRKMEKLIFDKEILNNDKTGLNADIISAIKSDPILFGKVAVAVGVSSATLPFLLRRNDKKLTQAKVLQEIENHLKVQDTPA